LSIFPLAKQKIKSKTYEIASVPYKHVTFKLMQGPQGSLASHLESVTTHPQIWSVVGRYRPCFTLTTWIALKITLVLAPQMSILIYQKGW